MSSFKPATKKKAKLRLGIAGPSGSGKTWSSLDIAKHLGASTAVIDSERHSAEKYSGTSGFKFDVATLDGNHHPERYIALMKEASVAYDTLIIDTLTHAWNGAGGFLELVEDLKKRGKGDNFSAWKTLTPLYNRLVETIMELPCHVIVTLRAKTEYSREQDDKGKASIKKLGMAAEFRDNFQYEMDISGMMNMDHELVIDKSRCSAVDNAIIAKPGKNFVDMVLPWLTDGESITVVAVPPVEVVQTSEFTTLLADIKGGKDLADVQRRARGAKQDGKLNDDEYRQLGVAFKEAMQQHA